MPAPLWKSFQKAQLASIAATVVDFGTLVSFVECLHWRPVYATALGAALGAVTNFVINRHWSFEASHIRVHGQAVRYALVSIGSLLLNSLGVWFGSEVLRISYVISKIFTALVVGFFYNFPLHRRFVFR